MATPTYTVQRGNSMWQIAHDNGLSLAELQQMNPQIKNNTIYPGDKVNLDFQYKTELVDLKEEAKREASYNTSNFRAIKSAYHNSNYAILDKAKGQMQVFDREGNLLYTADNIATGKSGNDYNTVTYAGNSGLENYAGNNSTPAGITKITGIGEYHGAPSFQRARYNPTTGKVNKVKGWKKGRDGKWYQTDELVDDNIASAMHTGNTSNRNISNGCVRIPANHLKQLANYLGVGDDIYTLPEKEGSRFVVKGGRLNFVADNPYGVTEKGHMSESGHDMVNWDDYNVHIDKSYSPLVIKQNKPTGNEEHDANALVFGNTLSTNKESLQSQFNLTSNEYNRLAQLAMGIAEQETKFGISKRYKFKQSLKQTRTDQYGNLTNDRWMLSLAKGIRDISKGRTPNWNAADSEGITQIKLAGDNKELKAIYEQLGVDEKSVNTPQGAAIATIARLAYMYNTEIKGRKFKGANNKNIDAFDALLYKYTGRKQELDNNTATPKKNKYIQNVKRYLDAFGYYEERKYRI